jgi:hypothetical protein
LLDCFGNFLHFFVAGWALNNPANQGQTVEYSQNTGAGGGVEGILFDRHSATPFLKLEN